MTCKAFLTILFAALAWAVQSQSPPEAPLPKPLQGLPRELAMDHFPSPVYASQDPESEPGMYFWKHNTSVLAPGNTAVVVECGAYIYYHEQWNLRATFDRKEFARLFDCPDGKLVAGEPYTFVENWRRDSRLLGGWALWYVIAETPSGGKLLGYAILETAGELIDLQNSRPE